LNRRASSLSIWRSATLSVIRITVMQVAVVVGFVLMAGTFWFFQIIEHEQFREMAENNHQRELALRAPRGVLFDRTGKVLVENRPAFSVSIVRLHTADLDRTIRLLSAVAGLDEKETAEVITGDAYQERVLASTAQAQSIGITGIPAFLLDRRFLVLGAQPRRVFEQALAQLDKQGPTD